MFLPGIMLVKGKSFHGSTSWIDKHKSLLAIAGSVSWFTEFKSVRFPAIQTPHRLLFHFYRHSLCCFLRGTFCLLHGGFSKFFPSGNGFYGFSGSPDQNRKARQ
jgi:hypothetical protein